MIIPFDRTISLEPTKDNHFIIMVDGQNKIYEDVEEIKLSGNGKPIKVIRQSNYDFIQKVNDKFLK